MSICGEVSAGDDSYLFKQNRILLILGSQWDDPESYLVSGNSEFKRVVVLLKSWCIPFDVVRLDEQTLDEHHFLRSNKRPRYGAVILLSNSYGNRRHYDLEPLRQAVMNHGIGLIALASFDPVLEPLLGIRWIGYGTVTGSIKLSTPHFLIEGLRKKKDIDFKYSSQKISIINNIDANVLAYRGKVPVLTVKRLKPGAICVWIGGNPEKILETQTERSWLRRAIAETIGYSVFRTWENHVILRMDDPGAAQNAWLRRWHYPTLTKQQICEFILKPLERHHAVLTVFVVPGFVNDETHSVEPSWQRRFIDKFGAAQDYPSTKKGLDLGVSKGLIEIQSHGWTHMQPDLESSPGPWWGSPLDAQRSEEEWYREFVDRIRGREIPASVQLRRMRISREWIRDQFGQDPVAFIPGGYGVSQSYRQNTYRLAGRAGFGWLDGYLGPDMAVQNWLFEGTEDVPEFKGVPPDGHDRGITINPAALGRYLKMRGRAKYIGYSEYIAYLHAKVTAEGEENKLTIIFEWSGPMGIPLVKKSSQWTLLISDWMRVLLGSKQYILIVDGEPTPVKASSLIRFEVPGGANRHRVVLASFDPSPIRLQKGDK